MSDATIPTILPAPPYEVREARVGPGDGKAVLHKVYPGNVPGDYLSADEAAVWAYLRHLEAYRDDAADRFAAVVRQRDDAESEVAALKARLADAEAELAGAIPHPTDASAAMGGAKKGKGVR